MVTPHSTFPMPAITDSLIESIHSSGYKVALVVAGGGSGAVHSLLSNPGASRFLFEAQVPYSPEAMFDYLGERLESYCSAQAAVTLAARAFERALTFSLSSTGSVPILGISCSAALQTRRERKGDDRAFVGIKSRTEEIVRELTVPDGSREEQEAFVSKALLECLAEFLQVHPV
jgi:nicotinamide mononucleotide (NMN) deamidase PncC